MTKSPKGDPAKCFEAKRAVGYVRVSSKEQDKEGFSIPAQQKLLAQYAQGERLTIAKEYIDIETAKQAGRANFEEMVRYLRSHRNVRIILVEKTDRMYRNIKDWVTLDELDIEIHFVKEGVVISRDSKSSEKFVHGIKVLMAKNYIDNLSEEARKGQLEKAEQGIWPSKAPLGYLNVTGPNGKKIIQPDPQSSSLIIQLFEWYASGLYSLKETAEKAKSVGLVYRRTGGPLPVSNIHAILRNRLYTGNFDWNGRRFVGRHLALVSHELWERVQAILEDRNARKAGRKTKNEFAFSGLISCGHCGCALVGELKKGRYVYYHCTGYKGKCPEPYVREEVLSERFSAVLGRLSFGDEVVSWVRTALLDSHTDQEQEHEAAIKRLQTEHERLRNRLHAVYVDKLDGKIDSDLYVQVSEQWRFEQDKIAADIALHQAADRSYLAEGVQLIDLAQGAKRLFADQEPKAQRQLLNFVLSNSTWQNGELSVVFRQPFDLIAETAAKANGSGGSGGLNPPEHPVWLGNLDSNQDKQSQSLLCYRYTIPQWISEQFQWVRKMFGAFAAAGQSVKSAAPRWRPSTRSLPCLASVAGGVFWEPASATSAISSRSRTGACTRWRARWPRQCSDRQLQVACFDSAHRKSPSTNCQASASARPAVPRLPATRRHAMLMHRNNRGRGQRCFRASRLT
jgi:site-specific DNA recombinase